MKTRWLGIILVALLAAVAVSCRRTLVDITVSPGGVATGRDGITITVRGTGFESSYIIRAGGREITTHFGAADILTGTLTQADLTMVVTDPEEKAIDIVVLNGPVGDIISTAAQFKIRKAFQFQAAVDIATIKQYVDHLEIHPTGSHSFLLTWLADQDLYGMTSTDDGSNWSLPVKLRSFAETYTGYYLARETSGRLLLVYCQAGKLYRTFSDDQGATWKTQVELSLVGAVESFSALFDQAGRLHMVWSPLGYNRFYYSRSGNGGSTWSAEEQVTETSGWGENPLTPAIISDGADRVMLCYKYQYGRYAWEKYFRNKTDGSGWEEIGDTRTAGLAPFILLDDGTLIVGGGYMNLPYMYKACVARSTDWGSTWNKELFAERYWYCRNLVRSGSRPLDAVMQLDSNYAVIRSLDLGVTWGSESVISDSHRSDNLSLAAVCADGTIRVFWQYKSNIFMALGE